MGAFVIRVLAAGALTADPSAGGGGSSKVAADAPTKYVDGGAIGVQLIRGDMSAMGLGTVTRVAGDKLLAFGHPVGATGVKQAVEIFKQQKGRAGDYQMAQRPLWGVAANMGGDDRTSVVTVYRKVD